ncbi:VOC family protein [Flavobacterium geliluteum]|uniref:Glyoxalase n=1 Tax=Flavobacterium geliluteum TaxID=2816120 RepID=A0A941AY57_9FLAO|nr:glyoxalase [Flavobacterium geliluteum]MBP4139960.1 glyoxalase [Flavobacterium geliluteum]
MKHNIKSIRPFIGAKDFQVSRSFYCDLGFEETVLAANLSVFKTNEIAFYLQDAYVKDWIDNSMIFIEVNDVHQFYKEIVALNITEKYQSAKLLPVKELDWGSEFFLHDPAGILWHFGTFNK